MTAINKKRVQIAKRRRRHANRHRENNRYIETFITQCIVCGIILSCVLIIRIIDVPTTNAIRQHFSNSITATVDIVEDFGNLRSTFGVIFNDANIENATYTYDAIPSQINPMDATNQDFRIDEDILESIRGGPGNER